MRVTQVALRPTDASNAAGRPALTPELLAATGARYSRSNDGLPAILAKIDPDNPDKSVDRIFQFVDYGHASIADMAPVALFLDGISQWLAYYLWSVCPTAGGQESSTRYIRLGEEVLIDPDTLGIPSTEHAAWRDRMRATYAAYRDALGFWEEIAEAKPEVTRIPQTLLDDASDRAQKQVARMVRNFAFDRARYFLPLATATNVMMVQSARAWVSVCQQLLSHPLPEARQLGEIVRGELELATPRLIRHAIPIASLAAGLATEQEQIAQLATTLSFAMNQPHPPTPHLETLPPSGEPDIDALFAADLKFHENRYAHIGPQLRRTAVRFGWDAVAFAEIRDLNRHRTGTKWCPFVPVGFYHATDQIPPQIEEADYVYLGEVGRDASLMARERIRTGDPSGVYDAVLGTQLPFEHTTTADKFLYEMELRTGVGAHFRYARHCHEMLQLWYERYPATRGLVLEGSAEPE